MSERCAGGHLVEDLGVSVEISDLPQRARERDGLICEESNNLEGAHRIGNKRKESGPRDKARKPRIALDRSGRGGGSTLTQEKIGKWIVPCGLRHKPRTALLDRQYAISRSS
jgi:hypothetical protein